MGLSSQAIVGTKWINECKGPRGAPGTLSGPASAATSRPGPRRPPGRGAVTDAGKSGFQCKGVGQKVPTRSRLHPQGQLRPCPWGSLHTELLFTEAALPWETPWPGALSG